MIYISNKYNPKMVKKNHTTLLYEVDIKTFRDKLVKLGSKTPFQFIIKNDSISDMKRMLSLLKILGLTFEGEFSGRTIESEEIDDRDIIFLGLATQSCGFRYFIIEFKQEFV